MNLQYYNAVVGRENMVGSFKSFCIYCIIIDIDHCYLVR